MNKKNIVKPIAYLIISAFSLHAYATGFDCSRATKSIEKMICNSEELSQKDDELNSAYKTAMKNLTIASDIKNDQREWLHRRNICTDQACLVSVYNERISTLKQQRILLKNINDPYIFDETAILTELEYRQLNIKLEKLRNLGSSISVVLVDSTNGEPISDFTNRIGNNWKVFNSNKPPDLIIAIAKSDRKIRLSTSNKFLSILSDQKAIDIAEGVMTPELKNGNYAQAIFLAIDNIEYEIKKFQEINSLAELDKKKKIAEEQEGIALIAKKQHENAIYQKYLANTEAQNKLAIETKAHDKKIMGNYLTIAGWVALVLIAFALIIWGYFWFGAKIKTNNNFIELIKRKLSSQAHINHASNCLKCGCKISVSASFCSHCGAIADSPQDLTNIQAIAFNKKLKLVLYILVPFIAFVLIIAISMILYQKSNSSKSINSTLLQSSQWKCNNEYWNFNLNGELTIENQGNPEGASPPERWATRMIGTYSEKGSSLITIINRLVVTSATPSDMQVAVSAGLSDFSQESITHYKMQLESRNLSLVQIKRNTNGKERTPKKTPTQCIKVQ